MMKLFYWVANVDRCRENLTIYMLGLTFMSILMGASSVIIGATHNWWFLIVVIPCAVWIYPVAAGIELAVKRR
jgi:hypothetical protein